MMARLMSKFFIIIILSKLCVCYTGPDKSSDPEFYASFKSIKKNNELIVSIAPKIIAIKLPEGYSRLKTDSLSFGF
jgi:hypothetical protein